MYLPTKRLICYSEYLWKHHLFDLHTRNTFGYQTVFVGSIVTVWNLTNKSRYYVKYFSNYSQNELINRVEIRLLYQNNLSSYYCRGQHTAGPIRGDPVSDITNICCFSCWLKKSQPCKNSSKQHHSKNGTQQF